MPLVSMTGLLAEARAGSYALCYCEAWNLESFQAVMMAAEEGGAPIIAGFNGGFLRHPVRAKPENLVYYASLGRALASGPSPVAFLLNETDDFTQLAQGIELGFNAVMVENEHLALDDYRQLVKRVVRLAHAADVSVEAAVGRLPDGSTRGQASGAVTDPLIAQRFVDETGIDALGVSAGNVHILTVGKASIDLDVLRRIHDTVKVPLVLHGGSGIPLELAQEVIACGVAKINFGTILKQVYLAAIREKLAAYREPLSPHPFLGVGGEEDILMAGREAVKLRVLELLAQCGSLGRARGA